MWDAPTVGGVVDFNSFELGGRTPLDGVMFVFDGGVTDDPASSFELPADELRAVEFVTLDDLDRYLIPRMAKRMRAAAAATASGQLVYLER